MAAAAIPPQNEKGVTMGNISIAIPTNEHASFYTGETICFTPFDLQLTKADYDYYYFKVKNGLFFGGELPKRISFDVDTSKMSNAAALIVNEGWTNIKFVSKSQQEEYNELNEEERKNFDLIFYVPTLRRQYEVDFWDIILRLHYNISPELEMEHFIEKMVDYNWHGIRNKKGEILQLTKENISHKITKEDNQRYLKAAAKRLDEELLNYQIDMVDFLTKRGCNKNVAYDFVNGGYENYKVLKD